MMKLILNITIILSLISLIYYNGIYGQEIILPYQPECDNPNPSIYRMNYPCEWNNEIARWDMGSLQFICYGIPKNYHVEYTIKPIQSNTDAYSSSIFTYDMDYPDYSSDLDTEMLMIDVFFTNWMHGKPNTDFPNIPINNDVALDTNPYLERNYYKNIISTRSNNNLGNAVFYITREEYKPQFQCLYFNISYSLI